MPEYHARDIKNLQTMLKERGLETLDTILRLRNSDKVQQKAAFNELCTHLPPDAHEKKMWLDDEVLKAVVVIKSRKEEEVGSQNPIHMLACLGLAGTPSLRDYMIRTGQLNKKQIVGVAAKIEEYLGSTKEHNIDGCMDFVLEKDADARIKKFFIQTLQKPFEELKAGLEVEPMGLKKKGMLIGEIVAYSIAALAIAVISITATVLRLLLPPSELMTKQAVMAAADLKGPTLLPALYTVYMPHCTQKVQSAIDKLCNREHVRSFARDVVANQVSTGFFDTQKSREK